MAFRILCCARRWIKRQLGREKSSIESFHAQNNCVLCSDLWFSGPDHDDSITSACYNKNKYSWPVCIISLSGSESRVYDTEQSFQWYHCRLDWSRVSSLPRPVEKVEARMSPALTLWAGTHRPSWHFTQHLSVSLSWFWSSPLRSSLVSDLCSSLQSLILLSPC